MSFCMAAATQDCPGLHSLYVPHSQCYSKSVTFEIARLHKAGYLLQFDYLIFWCITEYSSDDVFF